MILHRLVLPRAVAAAIPLESFRAMAELLAASNFKLDWRPGRSSFVGSITSGLVPRLLTLLSADGFTFALTTAPRTLDLDNTHELLRRTRSPGGYRLVAIRTVIAQFQIDRYTRNLHETTRI